MGADRIGGGSGGLSNIAAVHAYVWAGEKGLKRQRLSNVLREPVEDFVISAGEWQSPGIPAAQSKRGVRKFDAVERKLNCVTATHCRQSGAQPGSGSYTVSGKANCKIHIVELAGMRHNIARKIDGAAPDIFHFCIAQLRVDMDHAAAQNFGALPNGVGSFGKESGASAEEHPIVRGKAVIVEEVFGIVNHAVARAEFAS